MKIEDSTVEAMRPESDHSPPPVRRWWQYKRTWLVGVPLLLVAGVAGLFYWGSLQERPVGFAPVDPGPVAEIGIAPEPIESGEEIEPSEARESGGRDELEAVAEVEWTRYTLDATSYDDWTLFDFAEGTIVAGDFSTPDWDIALRRTKLLTNSGVTNPNGPGGAFDLGEVMLEEAVQPGSVEFVVDTLGGDDDDELQNEAAGKWYTYSFITHIVSVKPNTYLIRTGEDHDALVQFESYYCENDQSGCVTFRYRLVPKVADGAH